jgi:tRNA modification GTPase
MDYKDETIAAIATPIGVGGIGIIRISGHNAENIVRKIFRSKRPIKTLESFRLYLGYIIDPKSNLPLDEVLLSIMYAPFSYTRENVVEINSHSGHTILSSILQISDMSVQLAASQLAGGLWTRIEEIRQAIIEILTEIEAAIDFPDEESTTITRSHITDQINKKILKPIKEFISAYSQRKIWHEGVAVVIVGRVNAGKSSILNRLLQEERAIVTHIPGTTRDIIECMVNIEGLPVRLIDTAGIRKVKGKVEKKGVDLTKTQLTLADLTLLVVDWSRPLNKYDLNLLKGADKKTTIVVINKIDLPVKLSEKKIDYAFKHLSRVKVSALTGEGLKKLNKMIFNKVMDQQIDISPTPIIPNLRHKIALTKAANFLKNASTNLTSGFPLEIVAADLSWAKDAVDEITGNKTNEEILNNIFSRFCLGK